MRRYSRRAAVLAGAGSLLACMAFGPGCSQKPPAASRGPATAETSNPGTLPHLHKDDRERVVSATFEMHANVAGAATELRKHPALSELVFIESGRIDAAQVAPLAKLSGLQRIDFIRCSLTDEAVGELAKIKTLAHLTFGSTQLSETQIGILGTSRSLTRLVLKGTSFRYQSLAGFVRLKDVSLFLHDLKPSRIAGLDKMRQLQSLRLPETRITDDDLAALPSLPQLQELECLADRISDAGVLHFQKFPDLRRLSLVNSDVTDSGLAVLEQLPKLEVLNLEGCDDVTDDAVPYLLKSRRLTRLLLLDSGITGEGVPLLKDLPALHAISIGKNQITEEQAAAAMKARPRCRVIRLRQPPVAGGT
jgi:Leucine-rich repeat (LRR) protein